MKFTFKSLVAVAALASVGAAQAEDFFPPYLQSGTGHWELSVDALSGLKVSGSGLRAPAELPWVLPHAGSSNAAAYAVETGVASLGFSTLTQDGSRLASLQAPRSVLEIQRSVFDDQQDPDIVHRRLIYLANIDLDLNNFTINAELYARDLTAGTPITSFGKQTIFFADVPGIVGGTEGQIVYSPDFRSATASGSLAGNLRLNQNTANIILTRLGIQTDSEEGRLLREVSWGTFSFAASAVPEPSTYAMFGIGLLTMGALARRRSI